MLWLHRPAAHAKGGTDDLSAALGQTTVQLGVNMAAVAVPLDAMVGHGDVEGGSEEALGGSPWYVHPHTCFHRL